jgi:sulfur-oxidizing protein SoxA
MTSGTAARGLAAAAMLLVSVAVADDGRRSGLQFMGPALQALQRDDAQNPGMLWVQDGETLWRSPAGGSGKRCADCHGAASSSMAGVAARYPAWDAAGGTVLNLAGRINACRQRHQQAAPLPVEHADLLALSAYVGLQSRGMPVRPPDDARLEPLLQQGQALWQQRLGQLNLACLHCHDQRAGQRLGGASIPQGHASGYPAYRLEWQALGSLQRRLRGCVTGVRAEPWAVDAPQWLALEAWLAQRAAGMLVETPAVRP